MVPNAGRLGTLLQILLRVMNYRLEMGENQVI